MLKWLGLVVVLAGCASPDSDPSGPTPGEARAATCERACNRDYDVCTDGAGAQRGGRSFFGAGAACDRQVTACLPSCKALRVEPKKAGVPANGKDTAPASTESPAVKR